MHLIERDTLLADLSKLFEAARIQSGCMVFLGGEAGVGKTSLARAHSVAIDRRVRLLWGACDPLDTPPPLGPLYDMAVDSDRLADLLAADGSRHQVFKGVVEELQEPTLVVVDDAHWADDATLDLLRFVGRRVAGTRSQVLVIYRDDELGTGHPLRAVLGDLATAEGCLRLEIPLLSRDAVTTLALPHGVDGELLHRVTRGNPFFVCEVLADAESVVPATVGDAVLARLGRLPDDVRAAVEVLSVAPVGVSWDLIFRLGGQVAEAVPGAVNAGLLEKVDDRIWFRHELARLAVEETLSEPRRRDCHRLFLDLLETSADAQPALLAHHATGTGDALAAIRWARQAAEVAAQAGAHRQAADHLGRALIHAETAAPELVADLLEAEADQRHTYDDLDDVVTLRRRVLALRRDQRDRRGEGVALSRLANALWRTGPADAAMEAARDAVAAVEQLPPDAALAEVYGTRAFHASLRYERDEALEWAERARRIAEELDLPGIHALVLGVLGIVRLRHDEDPEGADLLEAAHRLARRNGNDLNAMRTLMNLGATWYALRDYGKAEQALNRVLAFCAARDLDTYADYAKAIVAHMRFEQGRWTESQALAKEVLDRSRYDSLAGVLSRVAAARTGVRRGKDGAAEQLDKAQVDGEPTGDIQRLWSVTGGRAEAAWLSGQPERIPSLVAETLDETRKMDPRWLTGELGFWLWRAGALSKLDASAAAPYRYHVDGDCKTAANAWAELGRPYEEAEALADSADETDLRKALTILDDLGARPRGDRLRKQMRELGITDIPARPRRLYKTERAGLTPRQGEVLMLLEEGASNAEIAERLFVSQKTAANHVSAILLALGVQNRTEAVHVARQMGIGETKK